MLNSTVTTTQFDQKLRDDFRSNYEGSQQSVSRGNGRIKRIVELPMVELTGANCTVGKLQNRFKYVL